VDLLLDDVRPGGPVVAHHQHDSGTVSLRTSVEVPTAPAELVTGLVLTGRWSWGPPRYD
jgi:hypothetical protein